MRDAVERLLESPELAIRRLARRGLLGEESTEDVLSGALVQARLVDRPGRPYAKFWHYDTSQALLLLSRLGLHRDPRADEAREVLAARRRPNGRGGNVGAVDWGDCALG